MNDFSISAFERVARATCATITLAVGLACAPGTVTAASIGGAAQATLGNAAWSTFGQSAGALDFAPLGGGTGMPQRRRPRASGAEITRLVDSLSMPQSELKYDADWAPVLREVPDSLQPEALLREADAAVWLDERSATRDVGYQRALGQRGLGDLLRGLVNVYEAPAAPLTRSLDTDPAPVRRAQGTGGGGTDLIHGLLETAIHPHRRADGRVGFSVFGMGEFVAQVDAALRSISLYEENTGWRASYQRPVAPPLNPVAAATDKVLSQDNVLTPLRAMPIHPVRPVEPMNVSVLAWAGDVLRWMEQSILLRVLLAAWLLYLAVRALVSMDQALRAGRRRAEFRARPVSTEAPVGATAPAQPAPHPSGVSRNSRRRRRSPSMRNLLRSLGLARA